MIDMYQIISKYLAGESSETENRELEAWRRLNEENERIFQELSESWVLANGSSFSPCYPDKEKIWNSNDLAYSGIWLRRPQTWDYRWSK